MIGTYLIAAWALFPAAEKTFKAPKTIDVVVLSRQAPKFISVLSGGCSIEGEKLNDLANLSSRRGKVRACGPQTQKRKPVCVDRTQVEVICREPMVLRASKHTARTYGLSASVRVKDGVLRVIATIQREHYVAGIVGSELAGAPVEAQIAQAVVARTFALRALKEPRHDDAPLCDLTHCQVYAGFTPMLSRAAAAPPRILLDAQGEAASVFYHSTCGGKTVSAKTIWGDTDAPDLIGIEDLDPSGRAWCRKSGHYGWVFEIEDKLLATTLASLAGRSLDPGTLELASKDAAGSRWKIMDRDGEIDLRGEELHLHLGRELGWSKVKSSLFVAKRAGHNFRLSGNGLGHRVGLCQTGSIARAKSGQKSREILTAYFPKLELVSVVDAEQ